MFCTNCHKIDITTGYLQQLGGNTSIQEKAILEVEFSMLHRHLIFSFVLLVQQTGTIIADDMYLCIELVSIATTYLLQSNMDQPRKVAKPACGQLYPPE